MKRITTITDNDSARFLSQPTTNKSRCCVRGCSSKAYKDLTVRFHSFPKNRGVEFVDVVNESGIVEKVCRRDLWKEQLIIDKPITENMRVCSLHFKSTDYVLPNAPTQKRYLIREAVPSCNLPTARVFHSPEKTDKMKTYERKVLPEKPKMLFPLRNNTTDLSESEIDLKTSTMSPTYLLRLNFPKDGATGEFSEVEIKEECLEPEINIEPPGVETKDTYSFDNNIWEARFAEGEYQDGGLSIKEEPDESETKLNSEDSEQEIDNNSKKTKFVITSNEDLNVLTGIPSFDILWTIVDMVKIVSPRLTNVTGLKLTIADRVIMTFMKLKQNLSYDVLSFFFKCSSKKSCKKIVLRTLQLLNDGLHLLLDAPSVFTGNVDEFFRQHPDIGLIVNRVEIAIRKPKIMERRIATRSRYKNWHSIKFVTAANSSGWISFISEAYDGFLSHSDLFKQSNVIKLLKQNGRLMILKDFPAIDDICREKGIKLVKSLYQGEISNRQHYRNFVNVNRQLRRFRIFRRRLSPSLSLRTAQLITVLCTLHNLILYNGTSMTNKEKLSKRKSGTKGR